MESDISLIEVAGEDDSLLQQIPEDDLLILEKDMDGITAGNSAFFLCSPLLTNRSNCTIAGSSTVSSSTDYTDKENINANNLEGPKLSIVPQQMKRKKKAGGYNLRKSLAWNKAFFTEEGVLDSMELSMITGSTSTSCGEALGVIDEEIPEMAGGGCNNELLLQDKLWNDTSTSTPSGNRKNGRCLLPKRGSSTKDNVKFKELSAKDVNRSGSKRGSCPRPVASSFARKPIASNATKTVNKEERISKIPVPKRDPTVTSKAPRNAATTRASDAKNNQVAQRAGSKPKVTTLKGSSINAKSALNKDVNASKSLKAKPSIQQPRRKLANPVLQVNSTRSQHESTDSNEGLKAATNSLISKSLSSNDDDIRKVSASITQNAPPDGRSMLNQTQMPKPSGLRMPSPSMGFFGQKKVSSFRSLPPATSEFHDPPKSKVPNVRIADPSNPICQLATLAPRNFMIASNGEASGETNVVSCLSSGISVEPVSHDRAKSALKVANVHLGKVNVVGASTMNPSSAHGLEKPDVRSLSNPVVEHLGDVSRIHDEINDRLAECKFRNVSFNNFGDSSKSYLDEANDLGAQCMPRAVDDQLNGAQDCNEQSSEQVELTNSSNCMVERTSPDHQRLGVGTCNSLKRSRSSIEFGHGRFEENVGNDSNDQESCSFDHDEAMETHKMRILRTRKEEASDVDHCISNECNNTMQSTSALSYSDSMHIDDEKPSVPVSNSKSLQGNSCSLTSQHGYTSLENEVLARESNEVHENKLESEIDLCLIPHSTADACLDSGPVERNSNYHIDEMIDIRSDMQQNNTSLEMERTQDDHGDVGIACNTDAAESETILISRDLHTIDTENQLRKAHIHIGSEHEQNEDEQNSPVLSSVDFNQLPGLAELQNSCIGPVEVSPKNNLGKCSIDELLHKTTSEEHNEEITTDSFVDNSSVCTSECLSNYNQMASPKDNSSVHEETDDTRTGDDILESQEIEASLRSSKCSTAKSSEYDNNLNEQGASETMSKEITSEARTKCNDSPFCSPTKDLVSSVSNDDILSWENDQKYMESKELENHKSLEMNGHILHQNENEFNSEMDLLLDTETCSTNDGNAQSEARASCDDTSFCSLTKDLGPSIPSDHILSRENVQELENHKSPEMNGNILCQNENELNSETDHLLDTDTCSTYEGNAQSEARTDCNNSSFCSPTKDLGSSVPNDPRLSRENIQQCMGTKELENHKSPEMNGNILCKNENELNGEMDHQQDTETCSAYDENSQSMQLKNSEDAEKQNALGIKTSTNVVPFSEEWLAAIEAAGEEILTMKTGAVQNSPPDKSQPEPGPWSPVKRKNNQGIGPFDCTKCTNASQLHESC